MKHSSQQRSSVGKLRNFWFILLFPKISEEITSTSIEEQIKKMWCIHTHTHTHTHGHYSTIEKNKTVPFAATWTDLEIITLSEISQAEKDKYFIISLTCGI